MIIADYLQPEKNMKSKELKIKEKILIKWGLCYYYGS